MKALRNALDSQHKHFAKGGRFEFFYPLYELVDTFLYTPGEVTKGDVHVRDGIDLKRLMITVAVALGPCILMAMYNTGYQGLLGLASVGASEVFWMERVFISSAIYRGRPCKYPCLLLVRCFVFCTYFPSYKHCRRYL